MPDCHLLQPQVTNGSHYTWDGAPHIAPLLAPLFLLMVALFSSR